MLGSLGTNPFPDATPEFFRTLETCVNMAVGGRVEIVPAPPKAAKAKPKVKAKSKAKAKAKAKTKAPARGRKQARRGK